MLMRGVMREGRSGVVGTTLGTKDVEARSGVIPPTLHGRLFIHVAPTRSSWTPSPQRRIDCNGLHELNLQHYSSNKDALRPDACLQRRATWRCLN
jgi:hypothetical protein